jgi:hypothetical protein
MIRFISALRPAARAAILLPFAFLASGCSDAENVEPAEGGSGATSTSGATAGSGAGATSNAGSSNAGTGSSGTNSAGSSNAGSGGDGQDTNTSAGGGGPEPVLLRSASDYVVLAKTAISNIPSSTITGDLGLSPNVATALTGFGALTDAGDHWTSTEVVGSLFAADSDAPTPGALTAAVLDMQAAYTDAAGRSNPDFLDLEAGDIGGQTLTPGLYKWASTVIIPSDVTLSGAANDVWIFQITNDLSLSAAQSMRLEGGAQARNVFWQVAGTVSFGTTSRAAGIFLSQTGIAVAAGAAVNGRLLAQSAVSLSSSTVTEPASGR